MATFANLSVQNREELKEYVKMSLGWPIISLEITDTQLDFVVDNALELYSKYGPVDEQYLALDLTKISFDYEAGTRELYNVDGMEIRKAEQLAKDGKYNKAITCGIKMPDNVIGIFDVNESGRGYSLSAFMVDGILLAPGAGWGMNSMAGSYGWYGLGYMTSWYCVTQAMKFAQQMRGYQFTFNYNERTKILSFEPDIRHSTVIGKATDGKGGPYDSDPRSHKFVIIGMYTCRDADDLAGEPLVKQLAVALAKIQVGQIRSKYSGINFPGGGQLGTEILAEGKEEYERVIEEIKNCNASVFFSLQQ